MSHRIEELKRRVQLDPASIAFAALAEEYRRAARFEEAIAICQAGLLRHPAYLSARVTLGRALLEIGRFDEARHELQLVLRSAPENLAAIRALAEIHDRGGDDSPEEASGGQLDTLPVAAAPIAAPAIPAPPIAAPPSTTPSIAAPATTAPPTAAPRIAPPPTAAPPTTAAAIVPATVHPASPAPRAHEPVAPTAAPATPAPAPPAVRVPHPDEAALPSLEVFLAAICAAKSSGRPSGQ